MSEPEGFLQRWSRRKRDTDAARREEKDVAQEAKAVEPNAGGPKPAEPNAAPKPPEFDLSTLPSLDEIGPGTKVDVFLQKGVPLDISRAALRRAWSSDPAIRDYIGLSENAWDFNATEGVPGFGPLEMTDDLRRMVAEMFTPEAKETRSVPAADETAAAPEEAPAKEPEAQASIADARRPQDALAQPESVEPQPARDETSASEPDAPAEPVQVARRGHGGAMPR